jgi:hypothetical protein
VPHPATKRLSRQTVDPRQRPNYRLPEATHYLRIPESTLRMWIFGQWYPTASGRWLSVH